MTVIRKRTARNIEYLESHGLADFGNLNVNMAPDMYRKRDPITGTVTSAPVDDGSPTYGV